MANNKVSEPIMVTVIANHAVLTVDTGASASGISEATYQAALTMEVDTGASASGISEATYQQLSQWKWIQGHLASVKQPTKQLSQWKWIQGHLHLASVKQPTNSSHNGSGYRGICICHQ